MVKKGWGGGSMEKSGGKKGALFLSGGLCAWWWSYSMAFASTGAKVESFTLRK